MSEPRTRPGGHVLWNTGEKITTDDLNEMGTMALQSIYHLLSRLCRDTVDDTPLEGFPGDDCKVSVSGLTATIADGFGLYYDTTATDEFGLIYRPIWVPADFTQAINAHEAQPRIDIISLAPSTDDDQSESRNVKDPSTGALSTSSVNKRRKLSYTVTYTAGTANVSPSVPTTPAGHIKLCELRVPATSGTIEVDDCRPLLDFGHDFAVDPGSEYASKFVPGSGTELEVTQSATPAMSVLVAEGEAVYNGVRRRYKRTTLTVAAADPTLGRIDSVVANTSGGVEIVAGTPDASPVAPALDADDVLLATVSVAAAAASIVNANILDERIREPISESQVQDDAISTAKIQDLAVSTAKMANLSVTTGKIANVAVDATKIAGSAVTTSKIADSNVTTAKIADGNVTGAKLSVVPVLPDITVGAEAGGAITATVQAQDVDGNNIARVVRFECEIIRKNGVRYLDAAEFTTAIGATGTEVSLSNDIAGGGTIGYMLIDSDASGQCQITVTDVVGGANRGVRLRVTPIGTPGYTNIAQLPFN